jgi:hypothetical protein
MGRLPAYIVETEAVGFYVAMTLGHHSLGVLTRVPWPPPYKLYADEVIKRIQLVLDPGRVPDAPYAHAKATVMGDGYPLDAAPAPVQEAFRVQSARGFKPRYRTDDVGLTYGTMQQGPTDRPWRWYPTVHVRPRGGR